MDLNIVPLENYLEDIIKGETSVQRWMPVKYFCYPCLYEGDNPEKQKAVYNFLVKNGYTIVPVTIDNDDYLFNVKIEKAQEEGNREAMKQIGQEYLEHMKERTGYFENMEQQKVGRQVHLLPVSFCFLKKNLFPIDKKNYFL